MAQAIVTPLNLQQAVEEIKQYIDGGSETGSPKDVKLRFKNVVVEAEDPENQRYTINPQFTKTHQQLSKNAENKKIQNLIYSNSLTIGDWEPYNWGDEIDKDDLSNYYTYNEEDDRYTLHLQYHYNVESLPNLSKFVKNNIRYVCGYDHYWYDEELDETQHETVEVICKGPSKNSYIYVNNENNELWVSIPTNIIFPDTSKVISDKSRKVSKKGGTKPKPEGGKKNNEKYEPMYVKFYPAPIFGTTGDGKKFNSVMIQNSELWVTDESNTINPETDSQYYLYIEHWNSKKQRWSAYMSHLGIQPIKFSEMEKYTSEYGNATYYKIPFDAFTFLNKLRKVELNPSLTLKIGIATDFQYNSISDDMYVNPKLINKIEQCIIKVQGHRFRNAVFNDNENENWLETDLLQTHFTAHTHRYYNVNIRRK